MAAPSDAVIASRGPWSRLRFLKHHKSIVVGAVIVAVVVLAALFAPVLSPYDPIDVHPFDRLKGIGDARLPAWRRSAGPRHAEPALVGGEELACHRRVPLAVSGSVGLILGSVAGYSRRIAETLIMRGMDVVFGLPPILLAIAVAATLGRVW